MPKNNRPVMGFRADGAVKREIVNVSKNPSRYSAGKSQFDDLLRSIFARINVGTCCSESQKDSLHRDIVALMSMESRRQRLAERDRGFGKMGELTAAEDSLHSAINSLVSAINSFRLGCGDCLRRDCPFRDTDSHPVQKVQERAGKFEQAKK